MMLSGQSKAILFLISIIVVLIMCLSLKTVQYDKYKKERDEKETVLQYKIQGIEKKLTEKGDTVYLQKVLVGELSNLKDSLEKENKYLKNISESIKVKAQWKTKKKAIPLQEPIYIHTVDTATKDTLYYLKIPSRFNYSDSSWLHIEGAIENKGAINIDSAEVILEPTINIGYKKYKWYQVFKENEIYATYTDKNPYVIVHSMEVVKFNKPKRINVAAYTGFGINVSPRGFVNAGFQAGVGIVYTIR